MIRARYHDEMRLVQQTWIVAPRRNFRKGICAGNEEKLLTAITAVEQSLETIRRVGGGTGRQLRVGSEHAISIEARERDHRKAMIAGRSGLMTSMRRNRGWKHYH